MKERKIMKKNNKGFSLVELIVVVLIMAIIATALTLAVTKYVSKSKR
ncbi:MAG: prepilin-type N-terminal cleavage/methylation domain-containing protein, partial [Butyrivibrio sp.]|nr:prepilin-type N-terminal cleavage/methylation domain-containing protein [Butyrivibrio sp.]